MANGTTIRQWELPVGTPGRVVTIRIDPSAASVETGFCWDALLPDGFRFIYGEGIFPSRAHAFEDARRQIARMDRAGDLPPSQFGLEDPA